jgi:plastocyanin
MVMWSFSSTSIKQTCKKGNTVHRNTRPGSFFASHSHKVWLVLLTLSALILLAACGGGTTSSSGSTPTAATGTTPTATTAGTTPTATTAASNGQAVTITTDSSGSFAFSPATLTVKVGTKVTWTNMTQAGHTVTSDDGKSFDSGISNPIAASGGTYSFTFTKAGTFPYHCQIHPFMKATITVTS